MKKIFGHTKKPGDTWDANRNSGYDWDEEDSGDFAYEDVEEDDMQEDGSPEYLILDSEQSSEAEDLNYDQIEAADTEYVEEPQSYEDPEEDQWTEEGEYTEEAQYTEEGEYTEEAQYTEEGEYTEEAQYTEEGEYTEEAQYTEEGEYTEEAQYTEEGEYTEEAQYSEEGEYTEEAQYAQDGEFTGEIQYVEEGEYTEDGQFEGEILYTEDGREEEQYNGEILYVEDYDEEPVRRTSRPASRRRYDYDDDEREEKRGFGFIDGIITLTGVAVVLLAVVVGIFFINSKNQQDPAELFVSVGNQIQGIDMIGSKGLLAVANAEMAKIEEINNSIPDYTDDDDFGYDENDYSTTVAVSMMFTSVQKDLKIKFTNRETTKLIGNVKFVVQVTKPDGTVEEWVDSDMDGIIYQKDIAAGKYSVALKPFDDDKYSNYVLPSTALTTDVKKDIQYVKVDVTGEGKKESEVNVNVEDTRKNETTVESSLTDTVAWVASTASGNTYTEVLKSTITDPMLLPEKVASTFLRITADGGDPLPTPDATPTPTPDATPTPTPDATPTPTPDATPTVSPSEVPSVKLPLKLDSSKVELKAKKEGAAADDTNTAVVKATVTGVKDTDVKYSVATGDEKVATAVLKDGGQITITAVGKGTTEIAVTAEYIGTPGEGEHTYTKATEKIAVTVTEKDALAITLDKTEFLGYSLSMDPPLEVLVTIKNSSLKAAQLTEANMIFTAVSDDAYVAQVYKKEFLPTTVDGTVTIKLTLVPQAVTEKKSCHIDITYQEGNEKVTAKASVTVKSNPKTDKVTKLKDNSKQQLYVFENNEYREAVYADYYTATKFFIASGVKYTGWQTINGKVYYFTAEGKYVTGEQVIQGARYQFGTDGALMNGNGVLGIDVSKWNGTIDWKAVKNSGVSFVIIRVGYRGSTGGSIIEDPKFATNIKGATEAGLKVGVYFFTQAIDEVEAVYEASFVLDKIKNYKLTYPVFLDVEPSGGRGDKIDKDTRTKVCKAFCQTIQSGGYTAGIYANKTWLNEKINTSELNAYKIWLAQYASVPSYTGRYDMWQYKSTGTVSGISGDVDLNLAYMGY